MLEYAAWFWDVFAGLKTLLCGLAVALDAVALQQALDQLLAHVRARHGSGVVWDQAREPENKRGGPTFPTPHLLARSAHEHAGFSGPPDLCQNGLSRPCDRAHRAEIA